MRKVWPALQDQSEDCLYLNIYVPSKYFSLELQGVPTSSGIDSGEIVKTEVNRKLLRKPHEMKLNIFQTTSGLLPVRPK